MSRPEAGLADLLKAASRFTWAVTLVGARAVTRVLRLGSPATKPELSTWVQEGEKRLDGPFEHAFKLAGRAQDHLLDGIFGARAPHEARSGTAFDPATFVVLGDGLSAGMGHFSLESSFQSTSFPALVAQALGTSLKQPLMQPPGLGDVLGLEPQPPVVPGIRQSTVLAELPQDADLGNLSVPGFSLRDALERRACAPLVDRTSSLQTLTNFILGLPDLEYGSDRGVTQIDYARRRRPTLALVSFGYDETLRSAVAGDYTTLPSKKAFEHRLGQLLRRLPVDTRVIVTTVPDPLNSAYFSSPETAAQILKTTPEFLSREWGVRGSDLVHLRGLWAMGYQTMAREVAPLGQSPTIDVRFADAVRDSVEEANDAVWKVAKQCGADVFDLNGVLAAVARDGLQVPSRHLSADYLGGLYLLNGAYPGPTLNARVAAEMALWIGSTFGVATQPVPLAEITAADANTLTQLAPGPPSTDAFLRPRDQDEIPQIQPPPGPVQPTPIQTTYPEFQPGKAGCTPAVGIPAAGLPDPSFDNPSFRPLEIPPEGLDYTLDLNPDLSCFGDALRPVDCPGEPPLISGLPPFGLCERTFFGGFLPTTSPLRGKIHVKISTADDDGKARFEIRHPGGLAGESGDLTGPQLFRMPVQHTTVRDLPGVVSSGVLDTRTGAVFDFHYNLQNMNSALYSLLKLNPTLPPPIHSTLLTFPGQPNGGSTWAEFMPREDGLFDISLGAHMFVPFGDGTGDQPLRFALPFTTPDLRAASFVARGTSIHPRIFVTTRPTPVASSRVVSSAGDCGDLPFDSVVEFCALSYGTYFGDAFELHAPELGEGGAIGRSQLLARVRVQFGSRTGDTVPVVFQILPPGGLLSDAPVPPPFLPSGVSRGSIGFDTVLHFPSQVYPQSGLASPDDPFNVCTTSVHLGSGQTVGPLLWRGFVVQALFGELVQVEPCTPADSFNYQGPARFECGADGELILHWNGTVFLPYPKGFAFPSSGSGGRPAITIQADSRLDPFRAVRATGPRALAADGVSSGKVEHARSPSTGAEFSYWWSIPRNPDRAHEARFEYTNLSQGGTFRLTSLSWVDCGRDVVTFSGFGTWSKVSETLHQVSAQIATSRVSPYVGIQIDGGVTSNVDIRPEKQLRA